MKQKATRARLDPRISGLGGSKQVEQRDRPERGSAMPVDDRGNRRARPRGRGRPGSWSRGLVLARDAGPLKISPIDEQGRRAERRRWPPGAPSGARAR